MKLLPSSYMVVKDDGSSMEFTLDEARQLQSMLNSALPTPMTDTFRGLPMPKPPTDASVSFPPIPERVAPADDPTIMGDKP